MGAMFFHVVARAQQPAGSVLDHAFFRSTGAQKSDSDPIDAHLLREATRHAKALLERDARTQHAAVIGMAANLRLHAAQLRATNLEPKLAQALKRRTRGRDRDALLDAALGPEAQQRHHDQLKALGVEDLHVNDREIPREQYDRMITTLSTPGALAGMLDQAADVFDRASAQIVAGRFSGDPHVVKVQDIGGWCGTMTTVCNFMKRPSPSSACSRVLASLSWLRPVP